MSMRKLLYIMGGVIFILIIGIIVKENKNNLQETDISGEKILYLGDSITEFSYMWRDEFEKETGVKSIGCYAKGGATWRVENNSKENNNIPEQVLQVIAEVTEKPDIIIISAGGNDWAMEEELMERLEGQFENNEGEVDVEDIDKYTLPGAIRWSVEKLKYFYPQAEIFLATNIQSAYDYETYSSMKLKADIIKKVAERMSLPVIDAFSLSGIYGGEEKLNQNGKYLQDGVHPSRKGGKRLGKCYAKEVLKYY